MSEQTSEPATVVRFLAATDCPVGRTALSGWPDTVRWAGHSTSSSPALALASELLCASGMRKRRRLDPFRSEPELEPLPPVDPEAALAAFLTSSELAGLAPADREIDWVKAFLDTVDKADWSWNDVDLAGLWAVLFDGLRWAIERTPDDPARVARVLDAFMRFAGRELGAPHAVMCSVYLRSGKAALDIGRWLVPGKSASVGQ